MLLSPRRRYDGWPWFREHVDLIAMILAKSDLGINANYDAQLVDGAPGGDGDGSGELGRDVRRRLAAARRAVLRVTRADDLSSGFLMLARSMKVRNPLVDPLVPPNGRMPPYVSHHYISVSLHRFPHLFQHAIRNVVRKAEASRGHS